MLSPVPKTGATERGASCAVCGLGIAVASAAIDGFDGAVCTAGTSGSSSLGFFASSGATTRSGSSVSVGVAFGSSVCSITALFHHSRRCGGGFGFGSWWQIVRFQAWRHQFDADLDCRRSKFLADLAGPQILKCQCDARGVDQDSAYRGRKPD